jgi:hypothetical protein
MAYPITDILGIEPFSAAILKSEGIRTTVGLLRSAKTPKQRLKLANKLRTDERKILDWVTTADRMRIKGVRWDYAQLLCAAGVKTVNELRFRNPEKLAQCMKAANEKRTLVRLVPSARMVERWIEDAKKLPPCIRY